MKILFFMTHPGFTRNFESTLALLAERGHQIHLAFDGPSQVGKPGAVEALEARYPARISHGSAPERDDAWSPLANAARAVRSYLRYLHPRYRQATRLRERAVVWPLGPALSVIAASPLGGQRGLGLLDALLRGLERIVPSSAEIERFIRPRRPDAVLLTPAVDFNGAQTDQLKSARALGIPTGVCVASWDNLTNKGLIQIAPDLVTVWNEHQRREAADLHRIPYGRVVATGAQVFDEWFVRRPTTSREQFCRQAGLPADRPFVLYTCSSQWIAPYEVPFVQRWVRVVRAAPEPLASIGLLIRPHPQNAAQWHHVDLNEDGGVAIWPRDPSARVDEESKANFFDSLHHSAAVVGINTSALIEAGIVGRPVFTILDVEYRSSQEGTLHFRYLVEVSGGLLRVASSLAEHVAQLGAALVDGDLDERAHRFVTSFVRPHGIDQPATPILANAVEQLQARSAPVGQTPRWVLAARPPLYGLALLARAAWSTLKREGVGVGESSMTRGVATALVVPHGFTARMFLRSTLLPELLERCERVGIFAPPSAIPQFRDRLPGDRFVFLPLHDRERKLDMVAGFTRLFFADWALTPTRQIREREEWARNPWRRALWPAHQRIGRSALLRRAWYAAENRLLPDPFHGTAFRQLAPDVVVTATAGVVVSDIRMIRRARAAGVPSVTFTQGWDNLTSKTIIGARPDQLIVWNERMREEAVELHGFCKEQITVAGPPHFDPYFRRTGWIGRSDFLRSLGLDPAKRIVLYATSPQRYFTDSVAVAELLVQANEAGRFGPDVQLVIRLHPQVIEGQDADDLGAWERFRGRVYLDMPRGATGLAADYTPDGIAHIAQLLDASAVTINVASSISIDAAIFDTPIVNLRFDAEPGRPYLQSVRRQYDTDHYLQVLRTGAVRLADSPEQLVDEVRRYLAERSLERAERVGLVRALCYRDDGQAGARVAEAIVRIGARRRLHTRQDVGVPSGAGH